MPLYDILNEFQKGSSHMAAVVKIKGKSKKPPLVIEEENSQDVAVTGESSLLTIPRLKAKNDKSDSVVVDIEKVTVPAAVNSPTSGDSLTNALTQSSDDIEDGEVIGIITLEDVFEELLQVPTGILLFSHILFCISSITNGTYISKLVMVQEEIVDETDEYVDVHRR